MIRRFIEHWFGRTEPYPIAAFRILFGVYLLAYFGSFAPHVVLSFSSSGVYVPYGIADFAPTALAACILYGVTVLAIVGFILGVATRVLTPALLVLYVHHFLLNLAVKDTAYDRLNLILLFILCFADLEGAWALGAIRRRAVSAWATRMVALQIALLYLGSGLWKLTNPYWHEGAMLKMTLAGPWGTELAFALLGLDLTDRAYGLLVWSVIGIELALPFLLYSRRLRPAGIALGVLFHLANAFLLSLPEFLSCVTAYVVFASPDTVRRAGDVLLPAFLVGTANDSDPASRHGEQGYGLRPRRGPC